jgi:hypothetical protein
MGTREDQFMSYAAEHHDPGRVRWFQNRKLWILAGVVIILGAGLIFLTNADWSPIPEVGGGLIIEADPDTRIYVGDELAGKRSVAFTWRQLFGDEKHPAIAAEIADPDQAITPEMLSGPDATFLSEPSGKAVTGTAHVQITQQSAHLVRRGDGSLDSVFALILVWSPPNQESRSYLLPVRLRKGPNPSTVCFDGGGSSIVGGQPPKIMRIFGRSPNEAKNKCSFKAVIPPTAFAKEISTKGFWETGGNK